MIVSIYLKEHQYLNNTPQTINFGGQYIYSFKENNDELIITRMFNKKYIPNFFDVTNSSCKIKLLSAIVGENGVGKSSLLDLIRSVFSENVYAFPDSRYVILVEEKGKTKVLQQSSSYSQIYLETDDDKIPISLKENHFQKIFIDTNELKTSSLENFQSIYYSPHLDLKYSRNFDQVDRYDISLDQYIKFDLEGMSKKNTNENGWKYPLHNELKFKNTLRVVEFMNSEIFANSDILEIFNLKVKYEEIDLIFRGIEMTSDFWNTPSQFRTIIKKIKETADNEMGKWHELRKFDKSHRVENQVEINRYILKRFIIISILSVITRTLEEDAGNFYLSEGEINEESKFNNEDLDAESLFLLFIKNTFVDRGGKRKIFEEDLYFNLFNEINSVITSIPNERDITNQRISIQLEKVIKIIDLHRACVKNLTKYFDEEKDKNLNLYEFISIDPFRNMSSGELALLNFFSRLYYFIENKSHLLNKQDLILLLDEADLGFHPIWKRKYVNAILKALPHFFEKIPSKPNLQIIVTTHDPLTLSDLPVNNVVFLHKQDEKFRVVTEKEKIQKTFGANISDLFAHSFFVGDGLIGDFAKNKIEEVINWINKNKNIHREKINTEELKLYKNIINLIDEKVIRIKLTEMITDLIPDDIYYDQMIDDEIRKLEILKKNDSNRYK